MTNKLLLFHSFIQAEFWTDFSAFAQQIKKMQKVWLACYNTSNLFWSNLSKVKVNKFNPFTLVSWCYFNWGTIFISSRNEQVLACCSFELKTSFSFFFMHLQDFLLERLKYFVNEFVHTVADTERQMNNHNHCNNLMKTFLKNATDKILCVCAWTSYH